MGSMLKWIKQKTRLAPVMAQSTEEHHCLITGDDRKTRLDVLYSTGEFLLDEDNELGFDVNQDAVRPLVKYGEPKFSVPHSILYESSGAPYSFPTGKFDANEQSTAQILQDGMTLAQVQAVQSIEAEDQANHLSLALTILSTGFAIMCIILVL